ncbi:hypothetical protein ACJ41O_005509 [Fusarium nematophilum]
MPYVWRPDLLAQTGFPTREALGEAAKKVVEEKRAEWEAKKHERHAQRRREMEEAKSIDEGADHPVEGNIAEQQEVSSKEETVSAPTESKLDTRAEENGDKKE